MTDRRLSFLTEFLRSPATVGAVTPSSAELARAATAPVPATGDPVVVELGPGTGVFTAEIARRLGGRGRQVAVELNPRLAAAVARRCPGVQVVTGDAAQVATVAGPGAVDVVVGGLPWAVFPAARQARILDAVAAALTPGGAFTTFAYRHARWTPPARRLHAALRHRFEEVVVGATVWRNLPPALVYTARRPVRRGAAGRVPELAGAR